MASPFALAPLRVACPACGAQIHPIAGRCRHCHVDLTRARADGPRPPTRAVTRAASTLRPRLAYVAALVVVVAIAAGTVAVT